MEFRELEKRAMTIRVRYAEFEKAKSGAAWTNEELALGFVGDVGDVAKLVMAVNGRREIANAREKLEHELADCLWSVMVLAHAHEVDLERAFARAMDELEERLSPND
ncbi:MAG: nucleotide pyrophosphohydrolase [Chloroflexi bacterium]|nr:nucleotide pyrophosphohydrolase [Chloroflexota bacterium]